MAKVRQLSYVKCRLSGSCNCYCCQ